MIKINDKCRFFKVYELNFRFIVYNIMQIYIINYNIIIMQGRLGRLL